MDGADLHRVAAVGARPARRVIGDIEMLRALAVLLVLDEHVQFNLVFWHSQLMDAQMRYFRGWVGVDLFFAISGFVIARSLLPQIQACQNRGTFMITVLRFWTRRAWRLLPSAWLWLLVPLAATALFNRSGAFGSFAASYEAAAAAVLQVANFRLAEVYGTRPLGASFMYWSLSLEEQFYLVLPIAAFLLRKHLPWVLVAIAALQFQAVHTALAWQTRSGALALGVLLALWERQLSWRLCEPRILGRSRFARATVIALPLALIGALGSDKLHVADCRVGLIALLVAGMVWIASYDRDLLMRPGYLKQALLWVGSRSYALYLIHIPVFFAAHEVWYRLSPPETTPHGWIAWVYLIATITVLFLIADINFRFVEVPLRSKGNLIAARVGRPFSIKVSG